MQLRVLPSAPASVASGSSSSTQKQLNIDLRLNVDIDNGKVRLSVPNQSSAISVEPGAFKPTTSSTQPLLVDHRSLNGSVNSRSSSHSQQQLPAGAVYTLEVQKPPEETYCVLCKRGYLPH